MGCRFYFATQNELFSSNLDEEKSSFQVPEFTIEKIHIWTNPLVKYSQLCYIIYMEPEMDIIFEVIFTVMEITGGNQTVEG